MTTHHALAIWDEFWENWVAENGLAKLYGDGAVPQMFDGLGLKRPANDNGILFLAYFIFSARNAGLDMEVRSKRLDVGTSIERLVRDGYRGLFDRIPCGGNPNYRVMEAHDNYVAIVALSLIYGLPYKNEILSHGQATGFNFNNVTPKKWDIKSQRQGGEIAFYYLCCGRNPEIFHYIWLLGGLIFSLFDSNAGRNNLTWLRLCALSCAEIKSFIFAFPLFIVSQVWLFTKWCFDESPKKNFQAYFSDKHPITQMAGHWKDYEWGF